MKKLLLLLAFISSIAFGIEKKTPTGGTVKDKPGKTQVAIGQEISYYQPTQAYHHDINNQWATVSDGATPKGFIKVPKGRWSCWANVRFNPDAGTDMSVCVTTTLNSNTGCNVGKNLNYGPGAYVLSLGPVVTSPYEFNFTSDNNTVYVNVYVTQNCWVNWVYLVCKRIG